MNTGTRLVACGNALESHRGAVQTGSLLDLLRGYHYQTPGRFCRPHQAVKVMVDIHQAVPA